MSETKIKAVLFDLDNTLMDYIRMKELAVNAALRAFMDSDVDMNFDSAKKQIYQIYKESHMDDQQVFEKFLKHYDRESDIKLVAKGVVAYKRAKSGNIITYPLVRKTLIELIKRGLKLGVVSDAPKFSGWTRLAELGLEDFFDVVVTFEDTNEKKPSQLPFKKAMEKIEKDNINPEEVLFVGDMPQKDLEGARRVGFKTAFAAYGFYETMLAIKPSRKKIEEIKTQYKPDHVLYRFDDLLKIVE